MAQVVNEVTLAAHRLARQRHGALIVFERETGLQEYVETGVLINSDVKAELLQTIFHPNTALHDKAVIIRDGKIVAAGDRSNRLRSADLLRDQRQRLGLQWLLPGLPRPPFQRL